MKTATIIQARMGSIRFPGKTMASLCGKPMIEYVLRACDKIKTDMHILTTTDGKDDDILEGYIISRNMHDKNTVKWIVERGGNKPLELAKWFLSAAQKHGIDYVVRVCGDNPCLDAVLANGLLEKINDDCDYLGYFEILPGPNESVFVHPKIKDKDGIFCEVFKTDALVRSFENGTVDMEHITGAFYNNPSIFKLGVIKFPDIPELSVDTPEDLERVGEYILRNLKEF